VRDTRKGTEACLITGRVASDTYLSDLEATASHAVQHDKQRAILVHGHLFKEDGKFRESANAVGLGAAN